MDPIKPLSLDDPDEWVEANCTAKRSKPERYAAELKRMGMDTDAVMQKYAEIYERVEKA